MLQPHPYFFQIIVKLTLRNDKTSESLNLKAISIGGLNCRLNCLIDFAVKFNRLTVLLLFALMFALTESDS